MQKEIIEEVTHQEEAPENLPGRLMEQSGNTNTRVGVTRVAEAWFRLVPVLLSCGGSELLHCSKEDALLR